MLGSVFQFFRDRLLINKNLETTIEVYKNEIKLLEESNQISLGNRVALENWNTYLQTKLDKLEDILYKRFGLIREANSSDESFPERIAAETWQGARRKLETFHRDERQEYWDNKLKEQEQKMKEREQVKEKEKANA